MQDITFDKWGLGEHSRQSRPYINAAIGKFSHLSIIPSKYQCGRKRMNNIALVHVEDRSTHMLFFHVQYFHCICVKLFFSVEQGCYFILVTDICLPNEQTGSRATNKETSGRKTLSDDSCAFVKHISSVKGCFPHKFLQICCKKGKRCSGQ